MYAGMEMPEALCHSPFPRPASLIAVLPTNKTRNIARGEIKATHDLVFPDSYYHHFVVFLPDGVDKVESMRV